MLRTNKEGEINCKDTIEYIQATLIRYTEQNQFIQKNKENVSPYKIVEEKLKAQGKIPSKNDIVEAYLNQMKEDLIKNIDYYPQSDSSMKSVSKDDNQFKCLAREGQPEDIEPIPLKILFEELKDTISRSVKNKGIASNGQKV